MVNGNPNHRTWTLREYRDADILGILELLETCFPDDLTPEKATSEHWYWEFKDLPRGPSDIFVAEDNGEIVGHYGCLPMILSTPQGLVSSRLVVDVMTHPEYQNQGMFTALGRYSMKTIGEKNSALALGFPTTQRKKQVMPGHLKVGWFPVVEIPVMGRPLNSANVANAKFQNRAIAKIAKWGLSFFLRIVKKWNKTLVNNDVSISQIHSPDDRFDAFWERIKLQYNLVQMRNASFVRWRFFDCPKREYTMLIAEIQGSIVGYIVLRSLDHLGMKGVLIVDLVFDENENRIPGMLIDRSYSYAQETNSDILACMILNPTVMMTLKKKGFMRTGETYTLIINRTTNELPKSMVNDGNSWFLSWADFDVI